MPAQDEALSKFLKAGVAYSLGSKWQVGHTPNLRLELMRQDNHILTYER